jgi:hypothetical protein
MQKRFCISASEVAVARRLWGSLLHVVGRIGLSVPLGGLQYLDGRWYVTHSGLLGIAPPEPRCGFQLQQSGRQAETARHCLIASR